MTNSVTKESINHGIYENIYAILNSIEGVEGKIFPSMPNVNLNFVASYPILILESPQVDLKQFSFGKNLTDGTITLTVYATQAKLRDQIADKVIYAIETNKGNLAIKNLRKVEFGVCTTDQIARGKIKVNMMSMPIKFKFYSNKTAAF